MFWEEQHVYFTSRIHTIPLVKNITVFVCKKSPQGAFKIVLTIN